MDFNLDQAIIEEIEKFAKRMAAAPRLKPEELKKPSLDDLKARWEIGVQYVKTFLNKNKQFRSAFILFRQDGSMLILPAVFVSTEEKLKFYSFAKASMHMLQCTHYMYFVETWLSETANRENFPTPMEDPNRKDTLIMGSVAHDHKTFKMFYINRRRKKGKLRTVLTDCGPGIETVDSVYEQIIPDSYMDLDIPTDRVTSTLRGAARAMGYTRGLQIYTYKNGNETEL